MKVINMELSKLRPYENNPRNNDDAVAKVANSIEEFGFKQPIVVDKDNVIIAGHTRYKASLKLGLETVPVVIADDLSEEKVKAYRLADNKTNEFASWDFDLLESELFDISDIDMSQFGFENSAAEEDVEVEEDNYTEQVEPVAKPGDMWRLGGHRLICGDATDKNTVNKLTEGKLADLLIIDPPYNVDVELKAGKIINDNMETTAFRQFLKESFETAFSFLRGGRRILHLALGKRRVQF